MRNTLNTLILLNSNFLLNVSVLQHVLVLLSYTHLPFNASFPQTYLSWWLETEKLLFFKNAKVISTGKTPFQTESGNKIQYISHLLEIIFVYMLENLSY